MVELLQFSLAPSLLLVPLVEVGVTEDGAMEEVSSENTANSEWSLSNM